MKTGMYVIYDKVAKEAGPIFTSKTEGVALRNWNAFVQNNDNKSLEIDDYDLLYIGMLDTEVPEIVDIEVKKIGIDIEMEFEGEEM